MSIKPFMCSISASSVDRDAIKVSIYGDLLSGESGQTAKSVYLNAEVLYPGTGDDVVVKYKTFGTLANVRIEVTASGRQVGTSPVEVEGLVHSAHCKCPRKNFDQWFKSYGCNERNAQIESDLDQFSEVDDFIIVVRMCIVSN
jgi:hypothetical protein